MWYRVLVRLVVNMHTLFFLYMEIVQGQVVQVDCSMQVTSTNVDIATVAPHYHLYSQTEVEEVISRL